MSENVMVPEYPTVIIGRRKATQKEVEILPLSWFDAKKLQETFIKLIQGCGSRAMQGKSESDIYRYAFITVCDAVGDLLPLIIDEEVDTKEITIEQVVTIAKIVYEQNFEAISKNVGSLLQEMGKNLGQTQETTTDQQD